MCRILIVEDEPNIRRLISVNLTARGFATQEARNAAQGLEMIRDCVPDAIILDVKLPGMSGWELLDMIVGDEVLPIIPVIVLTAQVLESDSNPMRYPNVCDVIFKPISGIDRLMQAVHHAVESQQDANA